MKSRKRGTEGPRSLGLQNMPNPGYPFYNLRRSHYGKPPHIASTRTTNRALYHDSRAVRVREKGRYCIQNDLGRCVRWSSPYNPKWKSILLM